MAVFILETDYPSGRTFASLFSASDNLSEYKYGHEDGFFVQTKYLRCASVKMYSLRFFQMDNPSVCVNTVVVRPVVLLEKLNIADG